MQRRVIIVGASTHAMTICDAIEYDEKMVVVGFVGDTEPIGMSIFGKKVLGNISMLSSLVESHSLDAYLVAIGDNSTRKRIAENIEKIIPGFPAEKCLHPSVTVGRGTTIAEGTVALAGSTIGPDCVLGHHVIINASTSLGAKCRLSNYASLAPSVALGSSVIIGEASAVCLGARIIQEIQIGEYSIIGAGATVLTCIPDRVVAYGSPARVIRKRDPDDRYLRSRTTGR